MSSIHKPEARMLVFEGKMFYSPNCSRTVPLPPHYDPNRSPFLPEGKPNEHQDFWKLDVANYCRPQWWHRAYGWIGFLPLVPMFSSPLFSRLLHATPRYLRLEDGKYVLDPHEKEAWVQLDNALYQAAVILKEHYHAPMILPCSPWAFGYLRTHTKFGTFRLCIRKSREWFAVWVAILSYLIAFGEKEEMRTQTYPSLAKLAWSTVLMQQGEKFGFDYTFIDALTQSMINPWMPHTPRAGTFLALPPHDIQPEPEWLSLLNLPFWYPWGPEQAVLEKYAHLAPPAHLLQGVYTFLTKSPPIPSDLSNPINRQPFPATTYTPPRVENFEIVEIIEEESNAISAPPSPTTNFTPRMKEFFAVRAITNAKRIEQESADAKAARLQRAAKPPGVSQRGKTKVYEWVKADYGPDYERVSVAAKFKDDTLAIYSAEQVIYDPVTNVYDCCELWGPGPDDSDDEGDANNANNANEIAPESTSFPKEARASIQEFEDQDPSRESYTQLQNDDPAGVVDDLESSLRVGLQMWYGYTSALPPADAPAIVGDPARKEACRIFGWLWDQVKDYQTIFDRPYVKAGLAFVKNLAANKPIDPEDWDLNRYNSRASIASSHRFDMIKKVTSVDNTTLYKFDIGFARTVRWDLAVHTASDALIICRLPLEWDERAIAYFLVKHGIAFHTLQPSSSVIRSPNVVRPSLETPFRTKDYVYTVHDYISYRKNCEAVLRHPRGRAALMRGNYIARIARTCVASEWVFDGPSGWSMDPSEMIVVVDPQTKVEYIDDKLTESEELVLIGRYSCYQDDGPGVTLRSWYMPPAMFSGSQNDHGHWSDFSEGHFTMLDKVLTQEGDSPAIPKLARQPHTQTEWRNFSRSSHALRKARLRLEAEAIKILSLQ